MEHMNCTLVELAHAMLTDSKLLEFLWEPAVAYAMYVQNLSHTKYTPKATPYQQWHGDKPDVSHYYNPPSNFSFLPSSGPPSMQPPVLPP